MVYKDRSSRSGSSENLRVAKETRLEEHSQVRPGTPRYMDTRHALQPSQALGDPYYVHGRAWTDTQILPACPHLEKSGLPTRVIPWSWIRLGPFTYLGPDPRSSQEAGADPKTEVLQLRAPPTRPGGNRAQSPGPGPKTPPLKAPPPGPRPQR